ncbi:5,6-dimethylbenzimidazole synthase [Stappia indica]|uniref:5,6-dimethylbenzimidazole synthase n=1 Tax=Stappia indica TaxID=538381 RepID=UPI001CD51DF9|nr:5,6-dimethylbenzimidazole synthase [Stappia indica]MCA1299296.1 5,6-dimethylbenzimidazole synthase [Stappia indica]
MSGPGEPSFDAGFHTRFLDLLAWRRDVRRFRPTPLEPALVEDLLAAAHMAPSVGNSQPWRFVLVDDPLRRGRVRDSFLRCNQRALEAYDGEAAGRYARLKLEGLDAAPVQLAVFCDEGTEQGRGLGRRTMPEMLAYSAVCAINTLWLAARIHGVGVGWVSILEPDVVTGALDVPASWRLIAYLCLGYPVEVHRDPELERSGWQARRGLNERILRR